MITSARVFKDFIKRDLDENFDQLDFYGSVYLDEPNIKWRGRRLIDRVDY